MSIDQVREKYGMGAAFWCEAKLREEGILPSEERIARCIKPSSAPAREKRMPYVAEGRTPYSKTMEEECR